jgi:thiol-disulfide isomerase/thioredoxin
MKRVISGILGAAALVLAACSTAGGPVVAPAGPAADYRDSRKEVVVLNFFDMYCHTCQTMAPHAKQLYEMAGKRGHGSRVDFYAIGWGNTPLEAEQYRQRYQIAYPVIPDRELAISKRFGRFRPPLMIVLERRGGALVEKTRIHDLRGDKEALLAKIVP